MNCSFCGKDKHNVGSCFERVRAEVSLVDVARHYGVELKSDGGGHRARCPLPEHQGERKNTPFWIAPNGKGFKCHSCKAEGNVIEFVVKMDGLRSALEAVKKLSDWFGLNGQPAAPKAEPPKLQAAEAACEPDPERNIPLKEKWSKPGKPSDGRLKNLNHVHPYLVQRGIEREIAEAWGVGYADRGQMAGRIAFPVCSHLGDVMGYLGRLVPGGQADVETEGKAAERWHCAKGFKKSLELFGIERARGGTVVLVESPWSVLRLAGLQIPAVAMMGSELSNRQIELLDRYSEIVIMLDGDKPGRAAMVRVGAKLLERQKSIRAVFIPDETQPDTIDLPDLLTLIGIADAA